MVGRLPKPAPLRINTQHRLAQGLLRAYAFPTRGSRIYDAGPYGIDAVPAGTKARYATGPYGFYYDANWAATRSEYATTGVFLGGKPANFSVFTLVNLRLTGGVEGLVGYWYQGGGGGPGAADQLFLLASVPGTPNAIQLRTFTSSSISTLSAANVVSPGWNAVGASIQQGQRGKAYANGRVVVDRAENNAPFRVATHAQSDIVLLNADRNWFTFLVADAGMSLCLMWDRTLSDADHASLAADPWQLFRPAHWPWRKALYIGAHLPLSPGTATVVAPKPLFALEVTGRARPRRKIINRNVSRLAQGDSSLEDIRLAVLDLQQAVEEMQQEEIHSREVESDGLPTHGSWCETFNGQYMRVVSLGETTSEPPETIPFAVQHNLKRKPQGIVWIRQGANGGGLAQVFIEGSNTRTIPPATESVVYFDHTGPLNAYSIGILI